jgi:hypothetical protein
VVRRLLIWGLIAGLAGGLAAAGFAHLAGEPAIDRAIAFEHGQPHAHGDAAEVPLVSRSVQKTAGLLIAAALYGLALGGLFALTFAVVYGRTTRAGPRTTVHWLAAVAFVVIFLVPFVRYPANPPAIGDPATIGRRTLLYAVMLSISILAAVAAARLRPVLERWLGAERATPLAVAVFGVLVVGAGLALPGAGTEIPANFPADTLWRFREASVGMQLVLWTTVALIFAPAAQRVLTGQPFSRPGARGRAGRRGPAPGRRGRSPTD